MRERERRAGLLNNIYNFFFIFKIPIQKILSFLNLKLTQIDKLPVETNKKIKKFIDISAEFSMTGHQRMYLLSQAILNTKENNLDGAFVECGVWRGGNILLYQLLNGFYNLNKNIFAYDTFQGMTTPKDVDINYRGESANKILLANKKSENIRNEYCFSTIDTVKKNILKYSKLENINFIIGPVEKTLLLEKNLPKKISILRLDTDWYSSTKIELEVLYPRLVKGGILIIDDYGYWQGSRKAVDEYFFNKKKWLHVCDHACRYLIKN
jgi:O-methyltransferase